MTDAHPACGPMTTLKMTRDDTTWTYTHGTFPSLSLNSSPNNDNPRHTLTLTFTITIPTPTPRISSSAHRFISSVPRGHRDRGAIYLLPWPPRRCRLDARARAMTIHHTHVHRAHSPTCATATEPRVSRATRTPGRTRPGTIKIKINSNSNNQRAAHIAHRNASNLPFSDLQTKTPHDIGHQRS